MYIALMKAVYIAGGAVSLGVLAYILKKNSKPTLVHQRKHTISNRYRLQQKSKTIDWAVVGKPIKPLNRLRLGYTTKGLIYGLDGHRVFAPYGPNGKPDFGHIMRL